MIIIGREANRIQNGVRNVFVGSIKQIVVIIMPFVIRTVIIYKLGDEYTGVTSLFSSILQVLNLSELGFSSVITYALYEPIAVGDRNKVCSLLNLFKKIYLGCGLFILLAGCLICPFVERLIKGSYPDDVNIYFVFLLLLFNSSLSYFLCGYKSVILVANQRNDLESRAQIVANMAMYCGQIIFLLLTNNYYVYIYMMLVGTVLNNLLYNHYAKKKFPEYIAQGQVDKKSQAKIIKNVLALFGHQLDVVIINSADNIIISMFLGLKAVTQYNNYYYVISAAISFIVMIANSFIAGIGNSLVLESKEKNYKTFKIFTYLLNGINVVCSVVMLCMFQDFIQIWLGKKYWFDMSTVVFLVISFYVRQFRRPVITYKSALGIWGKDFAKPYVAAILNLALNICLVKIWSINGVIISTIISMVLIEFPWETIILFQNYFQGKAKSYSFFILRQLVKSVMICVIEYFIFCSWQSTNIWIFITKGILSFFVACILFVVFSFDEDEYKDCFALAVSLIKNKL